jgi:hypothetical protein
MRSFGFTLLLALLATIACGLAAWHWIGKNFDNVLGAPPTPIGERIYGDFKADEVKHIQVRHNGTTAGFSLTENGWQANAPWDDRMDPRAAVSIINSTLAMRVEDLAPIDEVNMKEAGFGENEVSIRLDNGKDEPLARYNIGRITPWLATVKDIESPVPTMFIETRDENRKKHVYTCTGNILPLFKDNLKYLRDHHPFYFNPIALQRIRIRADQGELTLGRETPTSPWRIIKPLDLGTDPKAIKALIEGLFELQSLKLSDRAAVTLPDSSSLTKPGQIALTSFGSDRETVLEIQPPETPDARIVRATVSDRPGTVFDLPLKPELNLVSLAGLPLAVNDLRDPKLTNLNFQSVRGILIQPETEAEILVTRTSPGKWMVTIDGNAQEANEDRLLALLETVTEGRAIGFESDAATDLTPWGLQQPFLKLRFLGQDNQGLELAFGTDGKGGFFVNRLGTPTVMRIDQELISTLPIRPYQWRRSRLWSLDRINLMAIQRTLGKDTPLELRYSFNDEQWTGFMGEKNVTQSLDPARANFMLGILEGLKVARWLSPADEPAAAALASPSLVFKVIEKATNEVGDFNGLITRGILLAPGSSGPNPLFYYGRLSSDTNPFILDRDTYNKLAIELTEE